MRGLMIVLEGLDGTGKTTLAQGLAAALEAVPLSTPGAHLRDVRRRIDDVWRARPRSQQLFYAASVLAASDEAAEWLERGRDVVVDRYWLSTCVNARLRPDLLRLDELEAVLVPADLTLLLELDEPSRQRRLEERGMTAHDRATLLPEVADTLRQGYRAGLRRPVAGRGDVLCVNGLGVEAVVQSALARVERHRSVRPRIESSGVGL